MGGTFSCYGGFLGSMTDSFEALLMASSISTASSADNVRVPGNLLIEGSLMSFTGGAESSSVNALPDLSRPKHEAAVKLQKVYKSFRTRRQLADCAVLVEQRWWKLLDFAQLKRSSVSFFGLEKTESAVSRWSRARTRAAKVGKGLSKDEKAQKLALQHWLEAIDPRHRYGHNLQFYYDCWLKCESKQPFFYWLDVGEGKEVNLEEKCGRSKLQHQCIKYLGPKEREAYQIVIEDGKFVYQQSGKLLDSSEDPKDAKWIFVLSTSKKLYVGQKRKGKFQHSSFLAGGATSAAGRLVAENGVLKAVWPHSGHYRPTEENFKEFMNFLEENNVDLSNVKQSPAEGDDELPCGLRKSPSELGMIKRNMFVNPANSTDECYLANPKPVVEDKSSEGSIEIKRDCRESKEEVDDEEARVVKRPSQTDSECENEEPENSSSFQKRNDLLLEEEKEEAVASELVLGRMKKSKKGVRSYQLGEQLSCKWTTGAGPRIGCVREYPSELQFRALEQVNLSPKKCSSDFKICFTTSRELPQFSRLIN